MAVASPDDGVVGFWAYTQPLLDKAGLEDLTVVEGPENPKPPWQLRRPKVELTLADCSKQDHPTYVGVVAREEVDQLYKHHLQVCTDGSDGEAGVGSAFVIPSRSVSVRYTLTGVSIITAELVAIHQALQQILQSGPSDRPIAILSDSMASLMAIKHESGVRGDLVSGTLEDKCLS